MRGGELVNNSRMMAGWAMGIKQTDPLPKHPPTAIVALAKEQVFILSSSNLNLSNFYDCCYYFRCNNTASRLWHSGIGRKEYAAREEEGAVNVNSLTGRGKKIIFFENLFFHESA